MTLDFYGRQYEVEEGLYRVHSFFQHPEVEDAQAAMDDMADNLAASLAYVGEDPLTWETVDTYSVVDTVAMLSAKLGSWTLIPSQEEEV